MAGHLRKQFLPRMEERRRGHQAFNLETVGVRLDADYFVDKLPGVVGRDYEIDQAVQRLMHPNDKSLLFVGPAGA